MIAVVRQLETEGVLQLREAAVMTSTSSRVLRDAEQAVVTPIGGALPASHRRRRARTSPSK